MQKHQGSWVLTPCFTWLASCCCRGHGIPNVTPGRVLEGIWGLTKLQTLQLHTGIRLGYDIRLLSGVNVGHYHHESWNSSGIQRNHRDLQLRPQVSHPLHYRT